MLLSVSMLLIMVLLRAAPYNIAHDTPQSITAYVRTTSKGPMHMHNVTFLRRKTTIASPRARTCSGSRKPAAPLIRINFTLEASMTPLARPVRVLAVQNRHCQFEGPMESLFEKSIATYALAQQCTTSNMALMLHQRVTLALCTSAPATAHSQAITPREPTPRSHQQRVLQTLVDKLGTSHSSGDDAQCSGAMDDSPASCIGHWHAEEALSHKDGLNLNFGIYVSRLQADPCARWLHSWATSYRLHILAPLRLGSDDWVQHGLRKCDALLLGPFSPGFQRHWITWMVDMMSDVIVFLGWDEDTSISSLPGTRAALSFEDGGDEGVVIPARCTTLSETPKTHSEEGGLHDADSLNTMSTQVSCPSVPDPCQAGADLASGALHGLTYRGGQEIPISIVRKLESMAHELPHSFFVAMIEVDAQRRAIGYHANGTPFFLELYEQSLTMFEALQVARCRLFDA